MFLELVLLPKLEKNDSRKKKIFRQNNSSQLSNKQPACPRRLWATSIRRARYCMYWLSDIGGSLLRKLGAVGGIKSLSCLLFSIWIWCHTIVDGAKFWISCKRPAFLSPLQLIQNSVPSTIVWRQCDIRIRRNLIILGVLKKQLRNLLPLLHVVSLVYCYFRLVLWLLSFAGPLVKAEIS